MIRVLDLFSGIGGISLGLESTGGFETIAFCEQDAFCRLVLEKHWPEVPTFTDVRELRCSPGDADMIAGGFPCQDISVAGKGAGIDGERSGLWREMFRLVRECRPEWVLAENVGALRTRGADRVLADLEAEGYACWPLVVGAWAVGAPHKRERVWIVAHRDTSGRAAERGGGVLDGERAAQRDDANGRGLRPVGEPTGAGLEGQRPGAGEPEESEPRDAGALGNSENVGRGIGQDAGRDGATSLPIGSVRCQLARSGEGPRWPARPGEPQHEWEEPRLWYPPTRPSGTPWDLADSKGEPVRSAGQPREGTDSGRPEQPVGSTVDGLPTRLVRRANREALRAYGNSVVPQVVAVIGRAILASRE